MDSVPEWQARRGGILFAVAARKAGCVSRLRGPNSPTGVTGTRRCFYPRRGIPPMSGFSGGPHLFLRGEGHWPKLRGPCAYHAVAVSPREMSSAPSGSREKAGSGVILSSGSSRIRRNRAFASASLPRGGSERQWSAIASVDSSGPLCGSSEQGFRATLAGSWSPSLATAPRGPVMRSWQRTGNVRYEGWQSSRAKVRRSGDEGAGLFSDSGLPDPDLSGDPLCGRAGGRVSVRSHLFGVCHQGGAKTRLSSRRVVGSAEVGAVSPVGRLRIRSRAEVTEGIFKGFF